ncbi:MAG: WecB/TagA/CpsF family glycosyltransferase [Roseburia sp.]
MQNKIDILGIEIDNYTVKDSMFQVERYLEGGGMKTIGTITMSQLDLAGSDETVKECIRQLDLAVIGEKEILLAAGISSGQRTGEIVDHVFFRELMKRILRNRKKVFLLTESEADLEQMTQKLKDHYERLEIAGTCSIEGAQRDTDRVINEINSASADVVFSLLPSPDQEHFLMENKNKLDVKIWYGMSHDFMPRSRIHSIMELAGKLIHKRKLKSRLHEYNKE